MIGRRAHKKWAFISASLFHFVQKRKIIIRKYGQYAFQLVIFATIIFHICNRDFAPQFHVRMHQHQRQVVADIEKFIANHISFLPQRRYQSTSHWRKSCICEVFFFAPLFRLSIICFANIDMAKKTQKHMSNLTKFNLIIMHT